MGSEGGFRRSASTTTANKVAEGETPLALARKVRLDLLLDMLAVHSRENE